MAVCEGRRCQRRCSPKRPVTVLLSHIRGILLGCSVCSRRTRWSITSGYSLPSSPPRVLSYQPLIKASKRSRVVSCARAAVAFEYEYMPLKHLRRLLCHVRVHVHAYPDHHHGRPGVLPVHACRLLVLLGLLGPWPAAPSRRRRSRPALGGILSARY
jgi:hypothetical protein